jgi:5-methyltetrahydrofolate--homocysteine methyltransferase
MVIGTVYGDVHDIGKTLVSTLFKAAGFSVIDLGINIPAERFIEAVKEHKPDILGLSSLLSTTVPEQEVIIGALKKAGLRSTIKVLVGGGAVTQDWANHIGADAYGQDAAEAVEKGRWLLGLA